MVRLPSPTTRVTKDKLLATSVHGLGNQFGAINLLLFWKTEQAVAAVDNTTALQRDRAAWVPRQASCWLISRDDGSSEDTNLPLSKRRGFAVKFRECGSGSVVPPVIAQKSTPFLRGKLGSDRYGWTARATKSRNVDTRPSSLQEGRIRGSRGAVLRLHSPVRLCRPRGSGAREVTIARSGASAPREVGGRGRQVLRSASWAPRHRGCSGRTVCLSRRSARSAFLRDTRGAGCLPPGGSPTFLTDPRLRADRAFPPVILTGGYLRPGDGEVTRWYMGPRLQPPHHRKGVSFFTVCV